jgi:hypothetical protein
VNRVVCRAFPSLLGVLVAACAGPAPSFLCLPQDGRFELHYLHSVERSPVVEHYRVGPDGALWLEGMRFRSLGWGLPADGFVRRHGWFETTFPPRRIPALVLRVSRLAHQQLRAGRHALALSDVARDGAALQLAVGPARHCPRALLLRIHRAGPRGRAGSWWPVTARSMI